MANKLFGRFVRVEVDTGSYRGAFTNDKFTINFSVPFDDDPFPNEATVSIYNLSNSTRNNIKKGSYMTINAGYSSDGYGVLISGKISKVETKRNGVDDVTTFYISEGVDYSNINVKQTITFKSGVIAQQILYRLAGELGISFTSFNLPNNKAYSSGYTVEDTIIDKMEDVAKDCGASIYWRRGGLICRSITSGNDEHFTLEEDTGLIDTPEYWEDDTGKGWNIRSLLQYRISTASIIQLKSKAVNGSFRVKSGTHSYDGSSFITEAVVVY